MSVQSRHRDGRFAVETHAEGDALVDERAGTCDECGTPVKHDDSLCLPCVEQIHCTECGDRNEGGLDGLCPRCADLLICLECGRFVEPGELLCDQCST